MRLLLSFIVFACVLTMISCHEMDVDGKSAVVHDSLVTIFPTWEAVKIKVEDNNTNMLIVIGDATFYKATQDEKNKKAVQLGQMILRIFGKGNYLEKGNLIVTANTHNMSENPSDGINIPIDFASLKKLSGDK